MSNSQELPAGVPELSQSDYVELVFDDADTGYGNACVAYRLGAQRAAEARWIPVGERLPELGQSVALIDANGWENTGDSDLEMNIRACGYLSDGGYFKYWSIRGERATSLTAFTHWMPLPNPPKDPA